MYILKAISEDGYAEVVDSTTGDISFIDEYQKAMLKNQGVLSVPANIEKLEFLLGVYEQNTLYLIARHREELSTTIANAYITGKYTTAVEKCNSINNSFRAQGFTYVCTVIPKSRAKILLAACRAAKKAAKRTNNTR